MILGVLTVTTLASQMRNLRARRGKASSVIKRPSVDSREVSLGQEKKGLCKWEPTIYCSLVASSRYLVDVRKILSKDYDRCFSRGWKVSLWSQPVKHASWACRIWKNPILATHSEKHPGIRTPCARVLVSLHSQGAPEDMCSVAELAMASTPPPGGWAHTAPRRYEWMHFSVMPSHEK